MIITFQGVLGILAGIISFSAYIIYIISIVRGISKPNRVTWFIWTFMGLVLAITYYFSGARNTIWSPIVEFIGPLVIALLSIRYGEGGIKDKTDFICLAGAGISIVVWLLFDAPIVALVMNLIIDAFALIPTIKKSYTRPETEDFWAWFGTGAGDTLNLFAVERLSFGILIYPIYMLVSDLVIITILGIKKRYTIGRLKTAEDVQQ